LLSCRARARQPFELLGEPTGAGNIRAAALTPTGVSSANQLLATLTFEVVGSLGPLNLHALIAQGDDVTVNGISIVDSVTFVPSGVLNPIPEPTTAPLMGLGFAGLAAGGRRSREQATRSMDVSRRPGR